jgi:hypothetical protein
VPGIAFRRRWVRIQSIVFLLLMNQFNLYADAQAEQFYRANELFQKKQYQEARQEYEGLKTKGPIAWYNIGVCYGHEENPIESLVAFKRALKGADTKLLKEIFNGIDSARDYTFNSNPPKNKTMRKLHYYGSYFNLFWLQLLFLFSWFLLFLCWFYKKRTSRILRIFLGCCVIWSAFSTAAIWWLRSREYIIVMKKSPLYAGPNEEYHVVGNLEDAEQLTLLDSEKSWYKVKSPSTVGWVKEEIIKQV